MYIRTCVSERERVAAFGVCVCMCQRTRNSANHFPPLFCSALQAPYMRIPIDLKPITSVCLLTSSPQYPYVYQIQAPYMRMPMNLKPIISIHLWTASPLYQYAYQLRAPYISIPYMRTPIDSKPTTSAWLSTSSPLYQYAYQLRASRSDSMMYFLSFFLSWEAKSQLDYSTKIVCMSRGIHPTNRVFTPSPYE